MLRRGIQFEITKHLQSLKADGDVVWFVNILANELKLCNAQALLLKMVTNHDQELTDESLNRLLSWLQQHLASIKVSITNQLPLISFTYCPIIDHIEQHLQYLKTDDSVVAFFRVIAHELNWNNALIKIFLTVKKWLSTQSIITIFSMLRDLEDNSNDCNNNYNNHNGKRTVAKFKYKSVCKLETMAQDTFNHVGSYLKCNDAIYLSQCSHLLHTFIHNQSFIDCCKYNCMTVKLTHKQIESMVQDMPQSTPNLLCHSKYKCNQLIIEAPTNRVTCDYNDECVFCRFIQLIGHESVNSIDIMSYNYDLEWVVAILSNVNIIKLDNLWSCLWYRIPLKWLLKRAHGEPLHIDSISGMIFDRSGGLFARNYQNYYQKKCQSNIQNVRKICSIKIRSSTRSIYTRLNKNFTSIDIGYGKLYCTSLLQFLQIFHNNLKTFSINLDLDEQLNMKWAQIFFRAECDAYHQLTTDPSITSLVSFEKWLNQQIDQLKLSYDVDGLPQINVLVLRTQRTGRQHRSNKYLEFFNDSKLMALFNIHSTVCEISTANVNIETSEIDPHLGHVVNRIFCDFKHIKHIKIFDKFLDNISVERYFDYIECLFKQSYFEKNIYQILVHWNSNSTERNVVKLKKMVLLFRIDDAVEQPIEMVDCARGGKCMVVAKYMLREMRKIRNNLKTKTNVDSVRIELIFRKQTKG